MWDMHVHSHHSCDAHPAMEVMAEAAFDAGLQGMAFTEHLEWMPDDEATGFLDFPAFFAELQVVRHRWRDRLEILAGVEIGNSHRFLEQTHATLDAWPWDYVLGSAHWTGDVPGWLPQAFDVGIEAAYEQYFQELLWLARNGDFDILAHFDLVRRDSWAQIHQTLPLEGFSAAIDATLVAIIERGKGLEINTSPWDQGLSEPCPGLHILQRYRALGGRVLVLGSDAHQPRRVGAHFARARELALTAGFEALARYRERQVVDWLPL